MDGIWGKTPHVLLETILAFPSLLGLELGVCGAVLPPTRPQTAKAQFPYQGKEGPDTKTQT